MTKISIVAATISGNRGAEAMLTAVVGRLREKEPDAQINLFSYYPDADKRLNCVDNVRIFGSTPKYIVAVLFPLSIFYSFCHSIGLKFLLPFFPESIRQLSESNVLIDLAGVSFIDSRKKFIPFNILSIYPALILNTPVIKFSQAIGPCHHFVTKISARFILSKCVKIFARGGQTYQNLKELGLPTNLIDYAGDVAFCHKEGDSLSHENDQYVIDLISGLKTNKINSIIGICPSSVIAGNAGKEGWNYPAFLCELTSELIENGNTVVLFPNATIEANGEKLRNNDIPVIENVVRYCAAFNVNDSNLFFINKDINFESIKKIINLCDITIVSRFHAMIAALSLLTPVFVLGWGHKYLEVMEKFKLEEYVVDYKKNDTAHILCKLEDLMSNKVPIIKKIKEYLPEIERDSLKQFSFLYEYLNLKK
jgi:colanic acid/amylovoran biosynthesis protein WcaK/AmsJ